MKRRNYAAMTLREFFNAYVKPVCIRPDVTKTYLEQVDIAIRRFEELIGTPKLKDITVETLAEFRDKLMVYRTRPGKLLSPNTVRSKLKHVHAILGKAGPPNRYCRDAADALPRVPWIRSPRGVEPRIEVVSDKVFDRIYRACDLMTIPVTGAIPAPVYWRCLLALGLTTGLRRSNLIGPRPSEQGIRFDYIDWKQRLLVIPGRMMKMKREHVVPLNDVAMDHLEKMRGPREFVFPWPHCWRRLGDQMHLLQCYVGIRRDQQFQFHALRRSAGTRICQTAGLEAAKMILGHGSISITRQHYVWAGDAMRGAMDGLPMPEAFKNGKKPE